MVTDNSRVLSIDLAEERSRIRTGSSSNAIIAALTAVALGIATLFAVGFSHSELLHAAAHDVRHAAGFPCH